MAYFQRIWAQIDSHGVVQNRMVCDNYEEANRITRCTFGDESLAVEINQWNVDIGNKYIDGIFYRTDPETGENIECEYIPDTEEMASQNFNDITDVQEAIAEVYEMVIDDPTPIRIMTMSVNSRAMSSGMAKIYFALIDKKIKTIDDVPEQIKAEVEALLSNK